MDRSDVVRKLAREYHISNFEVYDLIQESIDDAMSDPGSPLFRYWNDIPHSGDVVTPEEVLDYIAIQIELEAGL